MLLSQCMNNGKFVVTERRLFQILKNLHKYKENIPFIGAEVIVHSYKIYKKKIPV